MILRRTVKKLAFLGLMTLALCGGASAQGVALSPAIINQRFKPGETFTTTVSVLNSGTQPVMLKSMTADLWFDPDTNERTVLPPGSHPRSASNWVEFVPDRVVVPPNTTMQVKLIVTPRKEVSGGYYSILFFETRPELMSNEKGQSVYTNFRIGSLMLLSAQGTEEYKVAISNYKITPPDAAHKLHAEFLVDNQSNTHILPRVQLAILDANKSFIGKTEGDVKRFMPGQKKTYSVDYAGELPAGDYTAVLTIVHEGGQVITREIPFHAPGVENK